MSKIEKLRNITTKSELAGLLKINPRDFTYILYKKNRSLFYTDFTIDKKNGGQRLILAPNPPLKDYQFKLSELLQDCSDEINNERNINSTLAHGFIRKKSIFTNAKMHVKKKNVLNIDIEDFFGSLNFGRVRGFFMHSRNFMLHPEIATVIANLACYNNTLPQGSPCSPIIANLITHILDINLAKIAKKYSCTYSRYADDISISTRHKKFPDQIIRLSESGYIIGDKIKQEMKRSGFKLNESKTRVQYQNSRQDVTGLVVNKKPNIKKEYWRLVKAQCNSLFNTGKFFKKTDDKEIEGNVNELEGKLNFIVYADKFYRDCDSAARSGSYKKGLTTELNLRERTFSKFLFYKYFYANPLPTILCEGPSDIIYLRSAIASLSKKHPILIDNETRKIKVSFINFNENVEKFLDIHGGVGKLKNFISNFDSKFKIYKAPKPSKPIIMILDNDEGFIDISKLLLSSKFTLRENITKDNIKKQEYIHIKHNLYLVLTPLVPERFNSKIEDFFKLETLSLKIGDKSFSGQNDYDIKTEYGKNYFAKVVVKKNRKNIDFSMFEEILSRIDKCVEDYGKLVLKGK